MNYDSVLQTDNILYGIVEGDGRIVFIKTGLGGSCMDPEQKYLIVARLLREKHGCSVIVSSNPNDGCDHTERDKQIISGYISDHGIPAPELLFFGSSNGCVKGLVLANAGVEFQRMILVNMPLMINYHKTKRYIAAIQQTEILAVYGEYDPSFSYIPFLEGKMPNVKIKTVAKADHQFQGMLDEFVALSELLIK